jgi:hypothetical protein
MAAQRHGPNGGYYWVPLELGVRVLSRRLIRSVDSRLQLCFGVLSVERRLSASPIPGSLVQESKVGRGSPCWSPCWSEFALPRSTAASDRRAAIGWFAGASVNLCFSFSEMIELLMELSEFCSKTCRRVLLLGLAREA